MSERVDRYRVDGAFVESDKKEKRHGQLESQRKIGAAANQGIE